MRSRRPGAASRGGVRALASAALLSLLAATGPACRHRPSAGKTEHVTLAPRAVYHRTLSGEGAHHFRFQAAAGRFLHLAVDQRGVDVVVWLWGPSGRLLFEVDRPTGKHGKEDVLAVTPAAGEYRLTVEPLAPEAEGDFVLQVREVRPARDGDRVRASAAAAFARGERRQFSGDPEAAVASYREALPGLAASGEHARMAEAEWHLGEVLLISGELREAAVWLERATVRFHGLGDGRGEARALNDLGAALRTLGQPARALEAHERSLLLYRQARVADGEASALHNIGLVYQTTGAFQPAIAQFEAALAIWQRLGAKGPQAVTLESLGRLYSMIGHDDEALDLLKQALGLLAPDDGRRVGVLLNLGWAEHLAGRPVRALERYREAIVLAERTGDRQALAGLWDYRGSALLALRRPREAEASYLRALALSRASGSSLGEGSTLANLGWLDLETGAVARSRRRLERSRELLAASGDVNREVSALIGLCRADRRLGDLGSARAHAKEAVRRVEEMRAGLHGGLSRGQFLATRYGAYEELASLLMELDRREPGQGHAREALETAERARARNLLEETAGGGAMAPDAVEVLRRRQELAAELQALDRRRQVLVDGDPRDPRLPRLDANRRARRLLLDRLAAPPPAPIARAPASAAEMQEVAGEDTLLVVYLLAEPASFAWTVDRGSVVPHVLPGRERIEGLARRFVTALAQSHELAAQGTVASAGREASQAILAPLGERLAAGRRLAVLADGALHLVPLAALPLPERAGVEAGPLLVQHEIVRVPSVTFLLAQRQRLAGRRPAPLEVALLADPTLAPADRRLPGSGAPGAAGDPRAAGFAPRSFERLPYTGEEGRAIARLVPEGEALLALGPAANRALVLNGGLRLYRILHFATHGVLDPVLPERSGLVLSLYDEKGRPRDGFLSAPEVAALDLPAEAVVLSACETGLGREMRGEGLVGLTQAFLRAGARRVVVSHWRVRDRATAELMTRFYRHLLTGKLPPGEALRAAQLSLRAEEPWRSPYFWAGFSLQGDWQ